MCELENASAKPLWHLLDPLKKDMSTISPTDIVFIATGIPQISYTLPEISWNPIFLLVQSPFSHETQRNPDTRLVDINVVRDGRARPQNRTCHGDPWSLVLRIIIRCANPICLSEYPMKNGGSFHSFSIVMLEKTMNNHHLYWIFPQKNGDFP